MSSNKYKFNCPTCHKTFSSKRNMENHINNKNINCEKMSYSYNLCCGLCNQTFKNVYQHKKHMKQKHGKDTVGFQKKLNCGFCNKKFSSNRSLQRHCLTACKVIKKRKENLIKTPLVDFDDFLTFDNKIIVKNLKKNNENLVYQCIDEYLKNSKNYNVYLTSNRTLIYKNNNWVKANRDAVVNKILDDIFYIIEKHNLNIFYKEIIKKYNKIFVSQYDKTQFKRIYLNDYLINKFLNLSKNEKINFI